MLGHEEIADLKNDKHHVVLNDKLKIRKVWLFRQLKK